ncbi:putative aquaporin-12A [Convolutriloba macropyga]|uniref:putative aquaporin-12A n=1 Tax=Convolutriloba macropyga TaxID=536237 RepID=UPI003F51C321
MSLTEEIFSVTLSCLCITTLTLFCAILRYLKRTYLPTNYQFITEEFICTFQIVAGVKEGDIVLDSTNNAAYFVFLFALFASFGLSFEESDGSGGTCGLWELYFFENISLPKCIIASMLQIMGGFAGLFYIKLFWRVIGLGSYHMKMFKHSTEDICESAMQSTLYEGMVAEFTATILFSIYSNSLRNSSLISSGKRSAYFDSFVTSVIVIVGMDYTGMMFNPALATTLTFNCKGHPMSEHVMVYWVAPFIATLLSCAFFNSQRNKVKLNKPKERTD